jgi:hypothetical protein
MQGSVFYTILKWLPYNPTIACPQVVDREGLKIWRVAANILNKQSWTANNGDPPVWGWEGG